MIQQLDIEKLIQIFTNNGAAVACLLYFMWYNSTTLKNFTDQMNEMNRNIERLIEKNLNDRAGS